MKKLLLPFLLIAVSFALIGSPSVGVAQNTDDDFQDALTQLRAERQAFKDARAEERAKASEEGKARGQAKREEAQQKREEARQKREDKRKETLLRLVDIQIKHWNKVNERVERMPNITDDLKAQLASEVDAAVQNLNSQKAKIEGAEGREEIKTLAKEIRASFKSKREVIKSIVDAIHASRANNAIAKAEERAAAIKAKVKELKDQGEDTTELEAELEDAEEGIDDAGDAIGRKAFREANEDLKGAYQNFRNIAQKAKNL